MSYRERQRLADIQAAIDAICSHLQRGDLSDGLIFDAVRIVPGGIDTQLWRNWVQRTADEQGMDYETRRAEVLSEAALGDISSPQDVASLALFLASDEGRTITGQSILCDAGIYMHG